MIGRVGTVEQLGRSVRLRRIRRADFHMYNSWLYLQVVGTSNDGISLKNNSACENSGGFFLIGGIHDLHIVFRLINCEATCFR